MTNLYLATPREPGAFDHLLAHSQHYHSDHGIVGVVIEQCDELSIPVGTKFLIPRVSALGGGPRLSRRQRRRAARKRSAS